MLQLIKPARQERMNRRWTRPWSSDINQNSKSWIKKSMIFLVLRVYHYLSANLYFLFTSETSRNAVRVDWVSLQCHARCSNVNSPGFCTRRNIHRWGGTPSHLPPLWGDAESCQKLPGWQEVRKILHLLVLSCLRLLGCPALPSLPERLSPHLGSRSL